MNFLWIIEISFIFLLHQITVLWRNGRRLSSNVKGRGTTDELTLLYRFESCQDYKKLKITIMGMFFIWISLSVGFMFTIFALLDIRTELRWRNRLLEKHNEILERERK